MNINFINRFNSFQTHYHYIVPVLGALLACHQLILYGYPYGHDWIFELVRLSEYLDAVKSGQTVPYWSNNLYYGFGAPVFTFYAPLYSALSAAVLSLGVSITTAATLVLVILMIISAVGMTLLMSQLLIEYPKTIANAASCVATISFLFAPYILSNMLIRNASAEFTALCLAPFPLLGLVYIYQNIRNGFFILSIGMALMVLAHNLSALLMSAMLVITALILFVPTKKYFEIKITLLAQFIGIGLTSWLWLPAFALKQFIRVSELQVGKLDFHNNFKELTELFSYDAFYSIGILPFFILLLSVASLFNKKNNQRIKLLLLVFACIFIILQTSISLFIWETLPLLSLFQFPWRMMGPLILIISLLSGFLFCEYVKKHTLVFGSLFVFMVVINTFHIFGNYRPIPDDIAPHISSMTTPEGIKNHGLPVTVGDEYLPVYADKDKITKKHIEKDVILEDNSIMIDKLKSESTNINFIMKSNQDTSLKIARWFFPGWKAKVNDKEYPLSYDEIGMIQLKLSAGENKIVVWLEQTQWRRAGILISLCMSLLLFTTYIYRKKINL